MCQYKHELQGVWIAHDSNKRGVVPFQIKRKLLYEAYMVLERVNRFSDVDMTVNDL